MKKTIIMLSAALFGSVGAFAAPVSQKTASEVALNFVAHQPGAAASLNVKSVEAMGQELFVVNFSPSGFAVVAADDTSDPIVGYSTSGNISISAMPDNMRYMLSEASQAVDIVKAKSNTANAKWTSFINGQIAQSRASGERVEPLISVNWNQSKPYNNYCPGEGSKKALVGCVAVAMSQAMSVQKYPLKPLGRKTYSAAGYGTITIDYDKEQPYDWNAILSGANSFDEAARLMYHAGVSVSMEYGTDGSGIPSNQVYRITDALKEHFGYGSDVTYQWRNSYNGNWEQFLLNELYADRAIVYNAIDSKGGYGHSFNIDGFNGDGMFHLNWGWGGVGNGYFSIDHLTDASMNMNYDSNHVAVVGIGAGNSAFRNIALSDLYVEKDKPAGTFVSVVLVNGEPVDDSKVKVSLTGEYNVASSEYMAVPFEYKNGIIQTTRPISLSEGPIYVRLEITMKDSSSTKLRQGFNIDIEDKVSLESKSSLKYDRSTKTFRLHTRYGASVKLRNAAGADIAIVKDPVLSEYTFTRDMLSVGNNVLEVSFEGETKVVNIKK